ncbi:DNA polymerase III subunit alpha [Candidatus Magnetomoraceae bacterium gMMP-1]
MSDFIHLHVHTEYSLLDGAIRLDSLIKRAGEFGMDSVAITDHGTMFGSIEFYEKARKAKIKPIIGCECYIAPRSRFDKTLEDKRGMRHLVLLAKNKEGYKNLCQLASLAQLEGFYYKPRIDKEILQKYSSGLICMSACLHGEIPWYLLNGFTEKADSTALWYQELFGENNFYLELQNNGIPAQETVNRELLEMHKRLSIPLVATNDCHYLNKEDTRAHDLLLCVQTGKTVNETNRLRFNTDQLYFKSPDEMISYFKDYPNAVENTLDIAERCNLEFNMDTYHFPVFETGTDQTADEFLEEMAWKGFEKILKRARAKDPDLDESVYKERLEKELNVIKSMGFPGYFLVVSDFIKYSKLNGIPVGPGRGSAAGSLVAYALEITDLDPIEHRLIFERFLNPARKSMPDIDVDFCIEGREEVFKYVSDRYGGSDYVAQIITFGKLKTRAVIRDVGRALDIPLSEVDAIAKMVPDELNITLEGALEKEPKLAALTREKSHIKELIDVCKVLEGLPRHASTHAAGVVIGDKPLVEYLPLFKGKKDEVVTQFSMKYVEKIGLVKFDFLGLRNLTVIEQTMQFIRGQGNTAPDLAKLDMNDKETYDLLQRGDTTGVFQLESSGMKELMIRLKPECFDDIVALVALYRPGPLDSGMVDDFVKRKHGVTPVEYLLPELEPILKNTYGVIVYQEQVMMIASALADYSMSEADDLRKAMGKKIFEILAKHRERFMQGAEKKGLDLKKAERIFDLMEMFGGYGFNKSHSAAYALISYQTAWLKTHYPVEFMASLLTSEMNNSDSVIKYINECRSHNINVLPPDINASDKKFTAKDNKIRFGLVAIKNVGQRAIDSILEVRGDKPFKSIFEFCERVDHRKVNKRVIEHLIKCGAFASTGAKRSQMMECLESAVDFGQTIQKEKNTNQMDLFGGQKVKLNYPVLPEIEEWNEAALLNYEKESLGFFITGHPLEKYITRLEKFTNTDSISLKELPDKTPVRVGGIITACKIIRTKRGDNMAFLTIEDLKGSVEVIVFSSLYADVADILVEDAPLLVQGRIQKDEKYTKIIGDQIIPVEKAEETWTASVHLKVNMTDLKTDILYKLNDLLTTYPGSSKGFLHLYMPGRTETIIDISEKTGFNPCQNLVRDVNNFLGYKAVETICRPITLKQQERKRKWKKT